MKIIKGGYLLEIENDYESGYLYASDILKNYCGAWTEIDFSVPVQIPSSYEFESNGYILTGSHHNNSFRWIKVNKGSCNSQYNDRFSHYYTYPLTLRNNANKQIAKVMDWINSIATNTYLRATLYGHEGEILNCLHGIYCNNYQWEKLQQQELIKILSDAGFNFDIAQSKFIETPKKEYRRYVNYNEDSQEIRTFRCYDIKHYVGTDIASDILGEMLNAVGLTLNLSGNYDEDIYDIIEEAKQKQLMKEIPEVIVEVVGTISEDEITDLLENEISEATGWPHDGFEWEEQKATDSDENNAMVYTQETEDALRLEIDTLLDGLSFEESGELENLCNGSDAELNDAHYSYDDEMVSCRPNIDGLNKYLVIIKTVKKIT